MAGSRRNALKLPGGTVALGIAIAVHRFRWEQS